MTRTCLECEEKLTGRIDKKFCSDYCRNTYNNKINKDKRNLVRNTNYRLKKNYNILLKYNEKGKTKIKKSTLISENFDFTVFTSLYITKKGSIYYYVYDEGYLPIDENYYLLVRK